MYVSKTHIIGSIKPLEESLKNIESWNCILIRRRVLVLAIDTRFTSCDHRPVNV